MVFTTRPADRRRYSFPWIWCLAWLGFWAAQTQALAAEPQARIPILYPGPDSTSGEDNRNRYFIELLRRALVRAGDHYQLLQGPRGLSTTRQFQLLKSGELDLTWNFSDPKWDPHFRQIRFPIDRGLMGWRLALVRSDRPELLSQVKSLEDLKAFSLAQGQAWQDTQILKANGLPVTGTSSYEGIFQMLRAGHIDYFPRSILEIETEVKTHRNYPLSIDTQLLIYYPIAYYYFVAPENKTLADEINRGLQGMYASGEFERFFMEYNGSFIRAAHTERRRLIRLNNPFFGPENLANLQVYGLTPPAASP